MSHPGPPGGVGIPASHRDLLERAVCGVLTTLLPDGTPHSCLVWVDHDGRHARVNTTRQRQSGRDMAADPRVSLLVVDPSDTGRFMQIRGRQPAGERVIAVIHAQRITLDAIHA